MSEDTEFKRGDTVFFICTNPDTGTVTRVSKKLAWVEVQWTYGKPSRVSKWHIRHLCPVLNGYLVRSGRIEDTQFLKKDYPKP